MSEQKPNSEEIQMWLSLPIQFFPIDKETFPIRLYHALQMIGRWDDTPPFKGEARLGDALALNAADYRCVNYGKATARKLADWQAYWWDRFGSDLDQELDRWLSIHRGSTTEGDRGGH